MMGEHLDQGSEDVGCGHMDIVTHHQSLNKLFTRQAAPFLVVK